MRKYRVVEIVTQKYTLYAVERRVLGVLWIQVDVNNMAVLDNKRGLYREKESADDAIAKFTDWDKYNHALANNRRAI